MREIGLAGHRAQRREFRRREPHQVIGIVLRIGNAIEPGFAGRVGPFHSAAELQAGWYFASLLGHLDLRYRALLDNSRGDVTGRATFSTIIPCCRSSAPSKAHLQRGTL